MNQDGRPEVISSAPTEQEVREELERVLASPQFTQSDRLARFLRFTVDHALSGKGDSLKEYLIGISVYDRKPPYHPSQDSIVRTEARRLRAKLKEYYETDGSGSRTYIYYRPGNYAPLFWRGSTVASGNSPAVEATNDLLAKGTGVPIAVLPFFDLSDNPLSMQCAQGLTDELTHAFITTDGVRVVSRAVLDQVMSVPWDIGSLMTKLNVQCAIEGTVRVDDGILRITIQVIDIDGFQSSSHRFESLADTKIIAHVQKQIVSAFVTRARPLQSLIRKRKATAGPLVLAVYPLVIHAETMLNEGCYTDLHPAMLKFQEAMRMAPLFARSYCGLAQCHIELALRGAIPSQDVVDKALTEAAKAVELDPEMFGCYSTLATANALAWNWRQASIDFARAADLGIHAPSSRQHALFHAAIGRFEEGTEHLDIAQRIDPFSYRQKVAYAKFLYLARRFEDLLKFCEQSKRYGEAPVESKLIVAAAAAHVGMKHIVFEIVDKIQAENQPQTLLLTSIAEVLALAGEHTRAYQIVKNHELLRTNSKISAFRRALLTLALGDADGALALLEDAQSRREAELIWLKVEPRLEPLRKDKVYQKLLSQVFQDFEAPESSNH